MAESSSNQIIKSMPSFDTLLEEKEISPQIWGYPFWVFLHSLPFITKKIDANHVALFRCLTKTLICKACQMPYQMFLDKHSPDQIVHRKELFLWVNELHNYVNNHLKKKVWTPKESYKAFKPIAKKYWERGLRAFMICLFRTYDPSKRENLVAFMSALCKVIPPGTFRTQAEDFMKNMPEDKYMIEKGIKWVVKNH